MRTAVPELLELEAPSRSLLEDCLQRIKHTHRTADRRVLKKEDTDGLCWVERGGRQGLWIRRRQADAETIVVMRT